MSENTDHETGGTLADDDIVTEQRYNVKQVCIQSAEPSNIYDGELWIDTDDNPHKLQTYDKTNTAWITNHPVWYESITDDLDNVNPATSPVIEGTLNMQYNSTTGKTYLYAYVDNGYNGSEWVARSDS